MNPKSSLSFEDLQMTMGAKSEIELNKGLKQDLNKMGDFVFQIYKTYIDYKRNLYPNLRYDNSKRFIPIVITLEPWNVNYNLLLKPMIIDIVKEKFLNDNLDISLIESNPFQIWSSQEFESNIQLINSLGISNFDIKLNDNTIIDYKKTFKYKDLFTEEFNSTFVEPLKNLT